VRVTNPDDAIAGITAASATTNNPAFDLIPGMVFVTPDSPFADQQALRANVGISFRNGRSLFLSSESWGEAGDGASLRLPLPEARSWYAEESVNVPNGSGYFRFTLMRLLDAQGREVANLTMNANDQALTHGGPVATDTYPGSGSCGREGTVGLGACLEVVPSAQDRRVRIELQDASGLSPAVNSWYEDAAGAGLLRLGREHPSRGDRARLDGAQPRRRGQRAPLRRHARPLDHGLRPDDRPGQRLSRPVTRVGDAKGFMTPPADPGSRPVAAGQVLPMRIALYAILFALFAGAGLALAQAPGGSHEEVKTPAPLVWYGADGKAHTYYLKCATGSRDLASCPAFSVWEENRLLDGLQTGRIPIGKIWYDPDQRILA
jgi:hypothetical protein